MGTTVTTLRSDIAWSPTMSLDLASPFAARTDQPVRVELSAIPAGVFPTDLFSATVTTTVLLGTDHAVPQQPIEVVSSSSADVFNASSDQPVAPLDGVVRDPYTGRRTYGAAGLRVTVVGTDGAWTDREFRLACDATSFPTALGQASVYSLDATPSVRLPRPSTFQSMREEVIVDGMLTQAPTDPPAEVTIILGGMTLTRLPLDDTGAARGEVRIPPYLHGQEVVLQAVNGDRVASSVVNVMPELALLRAPGRARAGDPITLTGGQYQPGEQVTITLVGRRGPGRHAFVVRTVADRRGRIAATVALRRANPGRWTAQAVGVDSRRRGYDEFIVR